MELTEQLVVPGLLKRPKSQAWQMSELVAPLTAASPQVPAGQGCTGTGKTVSSGGACCIHVMPKQAVNRFARAHLAL